MSNHVDREDIFAPSRREVLIAGGALGITFALPIPAIANSKYPGDTTMAIMTAKDGTHIYYKDWGPKDAEPIVFHHGWPLSSDDWDNQMLFFLSEGYRVIAFDRRGHGRSEQTDTGNEMDTYAGDTADLVSALGLNNAIHIGHSTGGGVAARAEAGRIAKVVLIGAVTPIMLRTDTNPEGTPMEVFDSFRAALVKNRAQFFRDVPAGPFYGFNRPGADVSQGLIDNWWRQGMAGGAKAQYDSIKAFSETDFTDDLTSIKIPVLVMHGEDDQVVPIAASAHKAIKLLRNGTLMTYPNLSHGLFATHPEAINADLLEFIRS